MAVARPPSTVATTPAPSRVAPSGTIRPAGARVSGGEGAGSAAGGKSFTEPQPLRPATTRSRAMARARTMRRRVARPRPPGEEQLMNSLPWLVIAALAAPVVIGRVTRTPLGVPHPPFVGAIDPHADPLLIVSRVLLRGRRAVGAAAAPRAAGRVRRGAHSR